MLAANKRRNGKYLSIKVRLPSASGTVFSSLAIRSERQANCASRRAAIMLIIWNRQQHNKQRSSENPIIVNCLCLYHPPSCQAFIIILSTARGGRRTKENKKHCAKKVVKARRGWNLIFRRTSCLLIKVGEIPNLEFHSEQEALMSDVGEEEEGERERNGKLWWWSFMGKRLAHAKDGVVGGRGGKSIAVPISAAIISATFPSSLSSSRPFAPRQTRW